MTRPDKSGGGLTGATGDLTPDTIQRDFEPGEWREANDPAHHADVTRSNASHAHEHVTPADLPSRDSDEPEGAPGSDDPHEPLEPRIGGDDRAEHEDHF